MSACWDVAVSLRVGKRGAASRCHCDKGYWVNSAEPALPSSSSFFSKG